MVRLPLAATLLSSAALLCASVQVEALDASTLRPQTRQMHDVARSGAQQEGFVIKKRSFGALQNDPQNLRHQARSLRPAHRHSHVARSQQRRTYEGDTDWSKNMGLPTDGSGNIKDMQSFIDSLKQMNTDWQKTSQEALNKGEAPPEFGQDLLPSSSDNDSEVNKAGSQDDWYGSEKNNDDDSYGGSNNKPKKDDTYGGETPKPKKEDTYGGDSSKNSPKKDDDDDTYGDDKSPPKTPKKPSTPKAPKKDDDDSYEKDDNPKPKPQPKVQPKPHPKPTPKPKPTDDDDSYDHESPKPKAPSGGSPSDLLSGIKKLLHGDMTYYDPGLNACGTHDSPDDYIVAVSQDMFDSFGSLDNSNNSPVCHKKVRITKNGKTAEARVTDACPGCSYNDLDMSPALFEHFCDKDIGRTDMHWGFIN